ncbi:MAG: mannose-1-phosphate guanylyltransferase [Sedimentisphaerales bacterium]|nr:mannose-1-phosphate guanylyltransferase [Sedimentisphaerales bacterium]
MNYAVIMAGGSGKRLWPLSRRTRPKQVLKLFQGQTLLRLCFERLSALFDARNILVLTNVGFADIVRESVTGLTPNNVIAEPVVRDTAGAVGLAASILTKFDPDATMAVVTADQMIEREEKFRQAIKDAINFVNANPERMVTFGIKPSFPSTQLGYIKCSWSQKYPRCKNEIYKVDHFREKPDEKTANRYINDGKHFWNSGMFVWKAKTILGHLSKYLPEAAEPLKKIAANWDGPIQEQTLKDIFPRLPKISIDFAVMEKAPEVYAIMLDCRWLDLGSFAALADIVKSDKNKNIVIAGQSELMDCKSSILVTEEAGHLVAAIGLDNMVVAHSPDATLVCPINEAYRLKELLERIEQHTGEKFL